MTVKLTTDVNPDITGRTNISRIMSAAHTRRSHHRIGRFGFPHVFGIPCGPEDRDIRIYQATLLQESPGPYSDSPPIYHIAPYRIFQSVGGINAFCAELSEPDDGWTVLFVADREVAPAAHHRHHRTWEYPAHGALASPTREVFFHGHWTSTGRAALSIFCSTAIPILEMSGSFRGPWPRHPDPPIRLTGSTPEVERAWERRWELDAWEDSVAREFAEVPVLWPSMDDDTDSGAWRAPAHRTGGAAAAAATAPPPPASLRPLPPPAIPAFVQAAVIRDAIARGTACPITMEPLTDPAQTTITPCFHLFDTTALASWRASGEDKCPTCRSSL
jgi:hypothetical protein